jgi:hypothetical protein
MFNQCVRGARLFIFLIATDEIRGYFTLHPFGVAALLSQKNNYYTLDFYVPNK